MTDAKGSPSHPVARSNASPHGTLGDGEARSSLCQDLARGLVAGMAGGLTMEGVLTALYKLEPRTVRARERSARRGQPAMRTAAVKLARLAGMRLRPDERRVAGRVVQIVMGVVPGMIYGALRTRVAGVRKGHGTAYGAVVSLVLDEAMNPLLGVTPGPRAFPWQTHARGLAGHLVYGAVVEWVLGHYEAHGNCRELRRCAVRKSPTSQPPTRWQPRGREHPEPKKSPVGR